MVTIRKIKQKVVIAKMHLTALVGATEFIKCIKGDRLNINQGLDDKSQALILKNREALKSVAKAVHFWTSKLFH